MKLILTVKTNDKTVTIEPYSFLGALMTIEYVEERLNVVCYLTIKK